MRHARFWLPGLCVMVAAGCPSSDMGGPATAGVGGVEPVVLAGMPAAGGGGRSAIAPAAGGGGGDRGAAGARAGSGGAGHGGSGGAAVGAQAPSGGHGGVGGEPVSAGGRSGRSGRGNGGGAAGHTAAGSGGRSGGGGRSDSAGSAADGCTPDFSCQPDPPPSTGDIKQDCVDRINQFRTECACLPALDRWEEGEDCADQMAMFDSSQNSAHAGFMMDICKGGNAQNECPGWSGATQVVDGCLQKMWDEGPPPSTPCTGDCFATYGHFINMTNKSMKRVACGFYKTEDGKVWAVQNFSP